MLHERNDRGSVAQSALDAGAIEGKGGMHGSRRWAGVATFCQCNFIYATFVVLLPGRFEVSAGARYEREHQKLEKMNANGHRYQVYVGLQIRCILSGMSHTHAHWHIARSLAPAMRKYRNRIVSETAWRLRSVFIANISS